MILARVRQDLPSFSFVSPIVPRFWWWLSRHALKTYLRMTLTSTRASFFSSSRLSLSCTSRLGERLSYCPSILYAIGADFWESKQGSVASAVIRGCTIRLYVKKQFVSAATWNGVSKTSELVILEVSIGKSVRHERSDICLLCAKHTEHHVESRREMTPTRAYRASGGQ